MKRLTCLLLALTTAPLLAGADSKEVVAPVTVDTPSLPISQEFELDGSYSGKIDTRQGSSVRGGVDDIHSHADYVISPEVKEGILLRFGVDGERNMFGLPTQAPLPNTLQSVNAIIGADIAVNDQILIRAEIHPGLFSDFVSLSGSDFDMPVQIGGTYLLNSNFQIIFGLQVDLKSEIPVIGIPGFRWQIADKWVLSAIPPRPQLQYQLNNAFTLYAGAEIFGGTYHLNDQFGSNHGHGTTSGSNNLDGNIVDFTEVRVGPGFTWKFSPNVSLDCSGGYTAYRAFDIHSDHIGFDHPGSTNFHNNIGDGSPYGEIGIIGKF